MPTTNCAALGLDMEAMTPAVALSSKANSGTIIKHTPHHSLFQTAFLRKQRERDIEKRKQDGGQGGQQPWVLAVPTMEVAQDGEMA